MGNRVSIVVRDMIIEHRANYHGFPGFTGSVFDRLDDIERAPGGSLLGCDITNPQPGLTTLFQELGDGVSMVTKTIETTARSRRAEDSDVLVSTVTIFAGDDDEQLARIASSKPILKPTSKSEYVRPRPLLI